MTSSAPGPSEWDEDPAWSRPDPMTAEEREAWLDHLAETDEPPEPDEEECWEPLTAGELAEIREFAEADTRVWAGVAGRRGPGQPGSARVYPGESASPAASFGPGMALDVLPGCAGLAAAADAAGGDDGFAGVSEGELVGLVCAWDRVEAHAAARKLAAIAELARRNPAPEDAEFTADEIACALGESRARAYDLLGTADHLDTRLPGTRAALHDGTISLAKARLIATATALLDPAEAYAAEEKVLDRAAGLIPGGLRAAIARAATPPNPPAIPSDPGSLARRIHSAPGTFGPDGGWQAKKIMTLLQGRVDPRLLRPNSVRPNVRFMLACVCSS